MYLIYHRTYFEVPFLARSFHEIDQIAWDWQAGRQAFGWKAARRVVHVSVRRKGDRFIFFYSKRREIREIPTANSTLVHSKSIPTVL